MIKLSRNIKRLDNLTYVVDSNEKIRLFLYQETEILQYEISPEIFVAGAI